MESSRLEVGAVFRAYHATPFLSGGIRYISFACHRELPLIQSAPLSHHLPHRFRRLTSHGFPYVVEVEHDGPAIRGQPPGIKFAPANDVLLCMFTGSLRPRHSKVGV